MLNVVVRNFDALTLTQPSLHKQRNGEKDK